MTAPGLDPEDWSDLRAQAHRMLDDMLDHLRDLRSGPVWRPMPPDVRARLLAPLQPASLAELHQQFREDILPYAVGNAHPGFMGWVHGGGCLPGMLGEMLAAGLDANLGGRDQAPILVERQILEWVKSIFGFPEGASGLFVTGTSLANFIAVLVARRAVLGEDVRQKGLGQAGDGLRAYASEAVHGCVPKALDMAGLGMNALRRLPVDAAGALELSALAQAVADDRAAGLCPFMVIGTAGTVDTGAIDDLSALADFSTREGLWFHVDGAFGALAILAPSLAPRLAGIERAHSLAFDFHKWAQVPYDAGFVLVRDGELHRSTFASPGAYLGREPRGLAAGEFWPCDYGPDLSRSFRALKTWFTLRACGPERIGQVIEECCRLARHLGERVAAQPELELMAPVSLNIVCFRHRGSDEFNAALVADLQESGLAAPSTTRLGGRLAIRAAIVNHRTMVQDVDRLWEAVLTLGARRETGGQP